MEGKRTQGQARDSERQERITRGRRRERTEISRGREKEIERPHRPGQLPAFLSLDGLLG